MSHVQLGQHSIIVIFLRLAPIPHLPYAVTDHVANTFALLNSFLDLFISLSDPSFALPASMNLVSNTGWLLTFRLVGQRSLLPQIVLQFREITSRLCSCLQRR